MMEYNVLVPFIYTPTGKGYNEGSTFATEDGERALILVEKGFLKAIDLPNTVIEPVSLKEKAKTLKIKGYTKMTDEQLEEAIAGAGAESKKVSD